MTDISPSDGVSLPRDESQALRMRRYLIAAGTSLLLCLATIFEWVRSYWREDLVTFQRNVQRFRYRQKWQAESSGGGLRFTYDRDRFWAPLQEGGGHFILDKVASEGC